MPIEVLTTKVCVAAQLAHLVRFTSQTGRCFSRGSIAAVEALRLGAWPPRCMSPPKLRTCSVSDTAHWDALPCQARLLRCTRGKKAKKVRRRSYFNQEPQASQQYRWSQEFDECALAPTQGTQQRHRVLKQHVQAVTAPGAIVEVSMRDAADLNDV